VRDIAEWGPGEKGLQVKTSKELSEAQVAAIAEIVASAKDGTIYRIKMHDKPSALALLLRWLDKLEKLKGEASNGEQDDDDGEDPREFLIRELTRIRARRAGNSGALPATDEAESAEAPVPMGVSGAS
jgi:MoxR-like ATPase